MEKHIGTIIYKLIDSKENGILKSVDIPGQFRSAEDNDYSIARAINAAFLLAMTNGLHPDSEAAINYIDRMKNSPKWGTIAGYYSEGINLIEDEIVRVCGNNIDFRDRLESLSSWILKEKYLSDNQETREKMWSVFFPEACGILKDVQGRIDALRTLRAVNITNLNDSPITDPIKQILFTSNVLLTIPRDLKKTGLEISDNLIRQLPDIVKEDQIFWYDHPMQLGVNTAGNEVLYGLKGLEKAFEFEKERGGLSSNTKGSCVLSVSVTHRGLHKIAKKYINDLLKESESINGVDVYVFTEADIDLLKKEIFIPAIEHYLRKNVTIESLDMLGVDGEYGRHYSFLKAVSAIWHVFIDPEVKATFKIDLDQVFPQKELVEQTGYSTFEHFRTPLWGAKGIDSLDSRIDLGMIAGALVNEKDIQESLFTPDVGFPDKEITPDELIFFSQLPQALSTEAEMMTRYSEASLDGEKRCIQRIHVTGGTNGILVDSLRRHRPFTPSFIGRAEDQAFVLSVMQREGERLAYIHKDGLIMRHDKEAFVTEAIRSAHIPKLIGDYIRILSFSAYAEELAGDVSKLKANVDPFTGCFISMIPITVVYLRFALKAASLFAEKDEGKGSEFIETGARRIAETLKFTHGKGNKLKDQLEKERIGWDLFYDVLLEIENGLFKGESYATELRKKAREIVGKCCVV